MKLNFMSLIKYKSNYFKINYFIKITHLIYLINISYKLIMFIIFLKYNK